MYRRAGSLAVIIAALIGASQLPAHAEILQNTEQYLRGTVATVARETPEAILKLEKGRVFDAVKSDAFDERAHTDDDVKPLQHQDGISAADGGSIPPGQHDTLIEKDGICRWVDNDSGVQYFIPKRTPEEVAAFVANLPTGTGDSNCCPAKVVTFTASDGQQRRFKLDVGREGATGPRGTVSLLHVFNLTRAADSATWQERVSETYTCANDVWTGSGAVRTGSVPELTLPKLCGSHLEGESWFEVTGNATRSATAAECPAGAADRTLAWNVESELRCIGGVPTATGVARTSGETWSGTCAVDPATIPTLVSFACYQWAKWGQRLYVNDAAGNTLIYQELWGHTPKNTSIRGAGWFPGGKFVIHAEHYNRGWAPNQIATDFYPDYMSNGKLCHSRRMRTEDGKDRNFNDLVCSYSWCEP